MGQDMTRLSEREAAYHFDSRLKNSFALGDSVEMDRAAGITSAGSGSTEHRMGLWRLRCTQLVGHQSSPLIWASVLYATSTAARESLPIWLFMVSHGGMGLDPSLIGVMFASGILMAEAGRAASIAGWHNASFRLDWVALPEEGFGRVLYAARARVVTVAVLGLLYLLSRLLPMFRGLSVLVIFVGIVVVAVNHIVFDLCKSLLMHPSAHDYVGNVGAAEGHEEEKQRAMNSTTEIVLASGTRITGKGTEFPPGMAFTKGSIVAGDVLTSSIGPLLLALVLSTGWPSPLDSSWWFVLCLTGDLWILLVSRETGARHARLPEGDRADFYEEGRSTIGFSQFV